MNENRCERVEQDHGEAVQRSRERALVKSLHRAAVEHYRQNPLPPAEPTKGVHYTELPAAQPGEALADEWNTYRREVERLLAQGHEGQWVLIKGRRSSVSGTAGTRPRRWPWNDT